MKKASEGSKSKDSKINALQLELSTLKKAAATSSNESRKELEKLSIELERLKEQKKALKDELDETKNEAKLRSEEDKSPELEKYKNEASDAAKVNAALRKELEEVRVQSGSLKSPKKKGDKENDSKIKVTLAINTKWDTNVLLETVAYMNAGAVLCQKIKSLYTC